MTSTELYIRLIIIATSDFQINWKNSVDSVESICWVSGGQNNLDDSYGEKYNRNFLFLQVLAQLHNANSKIVFTARKRSWF